MEPQLQNQLADLAHKLGTSIEKLWPILVDKARFDAVCEMIVGCVLLGVLLPFATRSYKVVRSELKEERYHRDIDKIMINSVALIFMGIFIFLGSVCLVESIGNIVYPEVAVIQNLRK